MNASRDENHVPTLLGVSDVDGTTPVTIYADPTTHRLLVGSSGGGGYTNLTQFVDQTPWRIFYSNASGDVTELALGANGTYLQSAGASSAPIWSTPAGSGDVVKVGTPVDNQVGVWTGDGTIEGDAALTFDTTTNLLTTGILNLTSLTASEIVLTDASKNLVSAAVATYPSPLELTYVKGVTSAIQTQLNAKQATITFGTGVETALGVNVGSAGSVVVNGGVLGTPSSGTVTNLTGTASININGTVGATTPTTGVFTTTTVNTGLLPDANDGAYLGQAGTAFSDLFLAEGGVINWDSSDVTLTQSGNTLTLAGGDLVLGENTAIDYDEVLSADGTYTGIVIDGTAGATLAFGDIIYLAVADSRWELADASAASTSGAVLVGVCVLAAAGDASATKILLSGTVRADTAFPTFTVSAPIYISETAGDCTNTAPTTTDSVTRTLGFGIDGNSMMFLPSSDYGTYI